MEPIQQLNDLYESGPVTFDGTTALITGLQEAKQVLGDQHHFVKDPFGDQSVDVASDPLSTIYVNMLSFDPPEHTRLRALVSKAFTQRQIQALAPRIQAITDELIDQFEHQETVDLVEAFAFPLPLTVICELLGVPAHDRVKFRRWSHAFLGIADSELSFINSLTDFVTYIGQVIATRRREPQDDLVSRLVHAEEGDDRLTEQELYSMIALLIVAGHETTVNLISGGVAALLQHPDQEALLRREPALIDGAIEEILRYTAPVELATYRYVAQDVELGGVRLPRGTAVMVHIGSANRDGAVWEAPDQLDLSREANKHLAFGYGIHYCLGAPLARLEAKIAFNTLLARLPTIALAVEPAQLRYETSGVTRGLAELPVRLR